MSIFNFIAVNCRACGKLVWSGHSSAGMPIKLDAERLGIVEEIVKKVSNLLTYEAHRTEVSFEASARIGASVVGSEYKPERVILAQHQCSTSKNNPAQFHFALPDYWGRDVKTKLEPGEIPF